MFFPFNLRLFGCIIQEIFHFFRFLKSLLSIWEIFFLVFFIVEFFTIVGGFLTDLISFHGGFSTQMQIFEVKVQNFSINIHLGKRILSTLLKKLLIKIILPFFNTRLIWRQNTLILNAIPIESLKPRVLLNLCKSLFTSQSFFRIFLQKAKNKVFTVLADHNIFFEFQFLF